MIQNRQFNIFWDMDGCLFKWVEGGDILRKGYFEELPSNRNIVEAAKRLDGMVMTNGAKLRCYVLSSYLTPKMTPHDTKGEKNAALNRETHFSQEQRVFLPCGGSKWAVIEEMGFAPNAVLVDDYGVNVSDWKGPYVKVSRDAADMAKECEKHEYAIYPEEDVAAIVNTICYAIENYIFL